MHIKKEDVLNLLFDQQYITEEDKIIIDQNTNDQNISDYLLAEKYLTPDLFGQALAEYFNVEYYDLNSNPTQPENLEKISEEMAHKHKLVFVSENEDSVSFTTSNPTAMEEIKDALGTGFGTKELKIYFSIEEDIDNVLVSYRKPIQSRLAEILQTNEKYTSELIAEIIREANTLGSSDIHFEPHVDGVLLRFRIDGVLHEIIQLEKDLYKNILNRMKILANVRIDQHYSPQDGAIRFDLGTEQVDLRLSITPIIEGEKIVIRVLSNYAKRLGLEDLGLAKAYVDILMKATEKTTGMILTTGPTGSGKTTTLYSVLKKLHTSKVNITTIEDPVEYRIKGVNQIQVDSFNDVTFSRGLRSVVRQDPDIILVGEIRDSETAEISVNAALTGHLLLSTFHANDASAAIPRLLDMGIEPFLLASTLSMIIAQRLVRKVCEHCRVSKEIGPEDMKEMLPQYTDYFDTETVRLFSGKGCEFCNSTGFKGRIGIFEVLVVTEEIMDQIMKNAAANDLWKLARSQGSKTFFEDGLSKVKTGITTLPELMRVAPVAFSQEMKQRSAKVKAKTKK